MLFQTHQQHKDPCDPKTLSNGVEHCDLEDTAPWDVVVAHHWGVHVSENRAWHNELHLWLIMDRARQELYLCHKDGLHVIICMHPVDLPEVLLVFMVKQHKTAHEHMPKLLEARSITQSKFGSCNTASFILFMTGLPVTNRATA